MKKRDLFKAYVLCAYLTFCGCLMMAVTAHAHILPSDGLQAMSGYRAACMDGDRIFAVRDDGQGIDVISVLTGLVMDSILTDKSGRLCATDGQRGLLYAADDKGVVRIVSTDTLDVLSSFDIGRNPSALTVDTARGIMIAADDKGVIVFVDPATLKIIKEVPSFEKPSAIAVDSSSGMAVIVHGTWGVQEGGGKGGARDGEGRDNVTIVDLQSLSVAMTLLAGKNPVSVTVNPSTHEASIANEKSDDITVIDLKSLTDKATLSVGKHPLSVSYNECLNTLSIIGGEDKGWLWGVDMDTLTGKTLQALSDKPETLLVHSPLNRAVITGRRGVALIDLPRPVPSRLVLTPESFIRGETSAALMIEGRGLLQSTEVSFNGHVVAADFLECGKMKAVIAGSLLQRAGQFEVRATNPAPAGGVSTAYYLTVENPVPSITSLDPAEARAGATELILTLHGTGFFDDTEVFLGGLKKAATYCDGAMRIHLSAADLASPGTYEITAVNRPPGGGASNSVGFTVKGQSFDVSITSPVANQTINRGRTVVKGTIQTDSGDVGIEINGMPADVKGSEWVAGDVPLVPGQNTITVTVSDAQGNRETKTVTVFVDNATERVALSANIRNGVAPLTTFFNVRTETDNPIVSYGIDYEGDGLFDYTDTDFGDIQFTYASEGIYYPAISVTDNKGNTYTDSIAVTVFSKKEIDGILKKRWEDMKAALYQKDIDRGMGHFLEWSRERYRQIFGLLIDELPQIVFDMKDIEMIYLENNVAKYRIRRDHVIDGQTVQITYYIYFGKDKDGIWRIDKF